MSRPQHYATRHKETLSPRQQHVLALIASGKTNFEIAEALDITIDGAKWHVREILAKLGCDSREEAAECWRSQNRPLRRLTRAFHAAILPFTGLRLAGAGLAVAAAGAATAVAVMAIAADGGTGSVATPPPSSPTAPAASITPAPQGSLVALRQPTADEPLRLWVGGDLNTASLGDAFQQFANSGGPFVLATDTRVSTGLTRPDYFDWLDALEDVADEQPDIVVFSVGINDWQGMTNADGSTFNAIAGSPPWLAEYARRIDEAMSALAAPGRLVLWVGQPIMPAPVTNSDYDGHMQRLNTIAQQAATQHPGVFFVSTRALFSDAAGNYARALPVGPSGTMEELRAGNDGVHFSPQGAERLASYLLAQVHTDTGVDLAPLAP